MYGLELAKFKNVNKEELSMIEVARAILKDKGDVMAFADLTNAVQQYLEKSDEEIRERLTQFYTDLNIDGSFISLGDNMWGLRSWYPYESIDEALVHSEEDDDDEDRPVRKNKKKVNAFLDDVSDDDDDVIDYDDDQEEDDDLESDYDDEEDDEDQELKEYSQDLSDIADDNDDQEDDLPDGIEGQLSELSDDALDEEI